MTEVPTPTEDEESFEKLDWALASAESLRRVWDNEYDAVYDNWRELYGISTAQRDFGSIESAAQDERNEGSASPL